MEVGWVPREIWLPRDSEPRKLQVFTRPEEEEPRVQICAGAGRGYGLSTTVSLGRYPRGEGGQEGPARTGLRFPEGANPGQRAPPAGLPTSQEKRSRWDSGLNSPTPLLPGGGVTRPD